MTPQSNVLLFDEFDIKDHSKTDLLKNGKKAFQKNCISNVSLTKKSLKGIYKKGSKTHEVAILKKHTQLIGLIDGEPTSPFPESIVALGYWYINYINENKSMIQTTTKQSHKSLKSLDKIQLVF